MKITRIETIQVPELENTIWVLVHTDEGITGLGESFRNTGSIAAYIHDTCAPALLKKDPRAIPEHQHALLQIVGSRFNGFPTRSVELRGNSAIDIALWDILGQSLNAPIHQLLGGLARPKIRGYNTCANADYNASRFAGGNQFIEAGRSAPKAVKGLHDYDLAMSQPDELALDLLESGIDGMKIWPFDRLAVDSRGGEITLAQLKPCVALIEKIRKATGDRMEILMEYHGRWQLPAALRIAEALEPLDIYWHEDPVQMDNFADLERFNRAAKGMTAGSESHGTKEWFREVLPRGAIDVALFDVGWIGGISEASRVIALAQAFQRPVAPHDCVGPVVLVASVHLVMNAPNGLRQEFVRSYMNAVYPKLVTHLPRIEDGWCIRCRAAGSVPRCIPICCGAPISSAESRNDGIERRRSVATQSCETQRRLKKTNARFDPIQPDPVESAFREGKPWIADIFLRHRPPLSAPPPCHKRRRPLKSAKYRSREGSQSRICRS
jgi:L-alanine-DL-glutamate epimerase-like enolase superfamily enzyme